MVEKDLNNFEHIWKLRDWMIGKLDYDALVLNTRGHYMIECIGDISNWRYLSQQQSALYLLEKNPERITWPCFRTNNWAYFILKRRPEMIDKRYVYGFESAMDYISDKVKNNIDEVDWNYLSWNPMAVHILLEHKDKIKWSYLALNSNPSVVDIIKEEMINIINNPNDPKYGMFWYCLIRNNKNSRIKEVLLENLDYFEKEVKEVCKGMIFLRQDIELLPYFEEKIKEMIIAKENNIEMDKLYLYNFNMLSANPVAVDLMLKYERMIDWNEFSHNTSPKAINYLKNHKNKIVWRSLQENRSNEAMDLIKEMILDGNIYDISYKTLSSNPYIFEIDYNFLERRMDRIRLELMEKTWHPKRYMEWCLSIQDL